MTGLSRTVGPTTLLVLAGLGLAAPAASAEPDRDKLVMQLLNFATAPEAAARDGVDPSRFREPASACDAVVAEMTKAGFKPTDLIGYSQTFPFKQAGEKCRAYAGWKAISEAMEPIRKADEALRATSAIKPGWGDASIATDDLALASACTAAIDQALAAGAPKDVVVPRHVYGEPELTVPQMRTDICDKLAAWANDFGAATTKAKEAQKAAAKQRYAQYGAAGDRLEWLAYYDADAKGTTWYTPGCKGIDDPKKLAKAPVLMQWWTADDGTVTIRRFQFKGNKLVKDTSKTFLTEAKASASGCK